MSLVIFSYIGDLIFGDPEWLPHPVRGMGRLIDALERCLGRKDTLWTGRIKGIILVFVVAGMSACCAYLFIGIFGKINPLLGALAWVYLGYACVSTKDLRLKAKAILKALEEGSIIKAQKELSKIVGRDTRNLDKDRMTVAAIESIAENTNDGIIAPLFYLILGGPVLAIVYKSINTLDSMVGHRNERYLHFGWFSAKLDDIVNFIPARICGILISISCVFNGKRFRQSFQTMIRDGSKRLSPNGGVCEAAMAGALGIRLGGIWAYQGKIITSPYLGDDKRAIRSSFITEALAISFLASILMVSLGVTLKWLI